MSDETSLDNSKPEGRIYIKTRPSASELASETRRPGYDNSKIARLEKPILAYGEFKETRHGLGLGFGLDMNYFKLMTLSVSLEDGSQKKLSRIRGDSKTAK